MGKEYSELFILHEIAFMSIPARWEDFYQEVIEKGTRLFSLTRFCVLDKQNGSEKLLLNYGFTDSDQALEAASSPQENTYLFQPPDSDIALYLEQKSSLTDWDKKIYNVFARRVAEIVEHFRAQQEIRLAEARMRSLYQLSHMTEASAEEIINFALEEGVRLTYSEYGYIYFLNNYSQSVQTSDFYWSGKVLQDCNIAKNYSYSLSRAGIWTRPLEEKKTLIFNDLQELPDKMGWPPGHLHLKRFMSTPIFEGENIVALAGVANKIEPYNQADLQQFELFTQGMWEILERRKNQQALRQAMKLKAVGTLAGGVAHDFNNILQAINMSAEILGTKDLPEGEKYLQEITRATSKGQRLVRQLLSFSRVMDAQKKPLDINSLLRDFTDMLSRTLPKNIQVKTDLNPELPLVEVDQEQLELALMNLTENAKDAMPSGGELCLDSDRVSLPQDSALQLDLSPGEYILIRVSDTGTGMDEKTVQQMFEPFYTTKEPGQGTGLGLPLVQDTTQTHGGGVDCQSTPGKGTTFCLYLPASNITRTQDLQSRSDSFQSKIRDQLRGTVLVVDDERTICQLLKEGLQEYGVEVLSATNGEQGLQIYQKNIQHIDWIIVDLWLPDIDGKECLRRLLEINPSAQVIMASGYPDHQLMLNPSQYGAAAAISKPYSLDELTRIMLRNGQNGS